MSMASCLPKTVLGQWPIQLWGIEQAIDAAAKDINWKPRIKI